MEKAAGNPLFDGVYNQKIEAAVSQTLGKPYRIDSLKSTPRGMHKCAVFSGTLGVSTPYEVFVKLGRDRKQSPDQFRIEAWQLDYLREYSPMATPKVLGLLLEEDLPLLILEAVPAVEPRAARTGNRLPRRWPASIGSPTTAAAWKPTPIWGSSARTTPGRTAGRNFMGSAGCGIP